MFNSLFPMADDRKKKTVEQTFGKHWIGRSITTQKQFQEYKEKGYQDWLNANDPEDVEN